MNEQNCIFCKIISRASPATIVAENEHVVVIKDIFPKAPVHLLIIPKKHIADVQSLLPEDDIYAAAMLQMARQLSVTETGRQDCKLIMNNGAGAGQLVFHLHCHFLSGKKIVEV